MEGAGPLLKSYFLLALLVLVAVPVVAMASATTETGTIITNGTTILHNSTVANVYSVLLDMQFNVHDPPQVEEFSLSLDGEATQIESRQAFWAMHQISITGSDNPVWVTSDPYRVTVLKNYYTYNGTDLCNTTRVIYSRFLNYFENVEVEYDLAVPVADNDLVIILQDSVANTSTIETVWTLQIDNSAYVNIEGNNYTPSDPLAWMGDILGTVIGFISTLQLMLGYLMQLTPYVPLVGAFIILDAVATGIFTGNWGPLGNITTTVINLVVSIVATIAALIASVNPF